MKIIKIKFSKIKKIFYKNNNIYKVLNDYNLENELKEHLVRVSGYATILADLMCIDSQKIILLEKGALLHDIGKISIDKYLLNKKSKLTLEEFEVIKTHPKLGINLLKKKNLNEVIENIVLLHHEKWNGTGYPFGLIGNLIPIEVQIVSVADYYDALTSKRIYKDKLSHEKALELLEKESGFSFSPDIISIFLLFQEKFEEMLKNYENRN